MAEGLVGRVTMRYRPNVDGNLDPGEIVWTWVPYEEHDGRGKDRPVLIVAGGSGTALLAVQLTSKGHDGDPEQVAIGSGSWDSSGRAGWVKIDRVTKALRARHGWT
ncbi:type II toxin-antitoxin system PemK/MazF family toxin [Microterricola viridarii]|uniref:PemK-like, MazF-like toxin of type II toxin-antitoxin system n=1 Tax=Microterricola viridarii TaxID=412690 RepID=A0A109QWM3_9MICO|nr:type II toxin-antitoxin system PemK/MazF family toxin [Microterricola viridarii]AMB58322.1 hypothetical protein AWU67_05015 [Microterricola viridarii]